MSEPSIANSTLEPAAPPLVMLWSTDSPNPPTPSPGGEGGVGVERPSPARGGAGGEVSRGLTPAPQIGTITESMENATAQLDARVTGRVHGVGFRMFVRDAAA